MGMQKDGVPFIIFLFFCLIYIIAWRLSIAKEFELGM